MYRSIPFMTQSFTFMHKLPRGRNFYPRGFDFAFGECDYFPPLRYLYSCRCLRTVNLAVGKHPVTPCGSFTAGTARTAIHGLGMPKRTSCALPRRSLYARMLTTARFPLCAPDSCTDTEGRWKYRCGKMQTKKPHKG